MGAMNGLRAEDQVGERSGVNGLDFRQAPVMAKGAAIGLIRRVMGGMRLMSQDSILASSAGRGLKPRKPFAPRDWIAYAFSKVVPLRHVVGATEGLCIPAK